MVRINVRNSTDSAVVSTQPAPLSSLNEASVISTVQDDLTVSQDEANMETGIQGFFNWFKKQSAAVSCDTD